MIIGYARTSTDRQEAGIEDQVRQLEELGCERIFQEQVSSVKEREQLDRALDVLRTGDTLVVTKQDRLARSVLGMGAIIERLRSVGAELRIIGLGIDTNTPTGKLMLDLISSISEWERTNMLERQQVGIEKAKREGKYTGSKKKFSDERLQRLLEQGHKPGEIAHILDVSRQAVHLRISALSEGV